jgi:rsbT antagonist protein RsbS
MSVAILRQGDQLIAMVQTDLSDHQILELRDELAERVGGHRIRGVVIDVSALDVIDSFVARALQSINETLRLRGATTVIVGIQPEVAMAIVQFNLNLEPLRPAVDVDEALDQLRTAANSNGDARH